VYAADGRCGDGVQSPDADRDTRDNLGKAISEIGSIIEVLQATDCANEEALGYLIDRLEKSRNQALDAFWRIFKMHPYDQGGAA
jgi:hypothetical protein